MVLESYANPRFLAVFLAAGRVAPGTKILKVLFFYLILEERDISPTKNPITL